MKKVLKYVIIINILICIFNIKVYSSESVRLAVLDFQSNGASKFATKAVSEIISTELAKRPELTVIERSQIGSILKEQGFQQTGCTEQECAVEMGKLLSVRKIVIGTLSKTGNSLVITVKVVNIETGKIDYADSEKCMSEDDLVQASKIISSKLSFEITGSSTSVKKNEKPLNNERYPFSIGVGVRFGSIYNVNVPVWDTNYKNEVVTNGKIDQLLIQTIVISPSYEFTKYFTLKTDLKYMIGNNLARDYQEDSVSDGYDQLDYNSSAENSFNGAGIAINPSFTYFKNKIGFFLSPGIGFDIYKMESSLFKMSYDYFSSNYSLSPQPQYEREYSVSVANTVYSPLLKLETGILYNLDQNFDFFISFGVDYHFYSKLFSDISLKEEWAWNQGTPPSYIGNLEIDYKGNFPPEFYIQAGLNFRLF